MSGGGSNGTTTQQTGTSATTNTMLPYGKGKDLLNTGLADALNLYKGGKLNPYVAPSASTNNALQGLSKAALASRPSLNSALSTFTNFSKGGGNISSGAQTDIAGKAMAPSYSEQNLAGVAAGDMLNKDDPNFERLLASAKDSAGTAARMSAGGMGRYGGDFAQTEVARTVGDLEAGQRYQRLNDERTRQVEANSLMDSMHQAGLGLGLNATNSASSIDAANKDRQMGAAGAIPGAYQATLDPYKTALDVGHEYDANNAARLGNKGANLSSLAQIMQMISPYGTQIGTQTSTGTGTSKEPFNWAQLAGGGLGGLSLLKQLAII